MIPGAELSPQDRPDRAQAEEMAVQVGVETAAILIRIHCISGPVATGPHYTWHVPVQEGNFNKVTIHDR
jgi:hypothetical protein